MNGRIAWSDEDFSDGRERSIRTAYGRFRIARLPIAVVVIGGLVAAAVVSGIVTWLVSGNDARTAANGPPPLIKADEKPIKVYPASPGGLEVPNRDKLVYSRLKDGRESGGEVERLSPAPEAPLAPPTMLMKPPVAEAMAPPSARSPTGSPFPEAPAAAPQTQTPSIVEETAPVPALPAPAVAAVKPVTAPPPASKPVVRTEKPATQAEKPATRTVAAPPTVTKAPSTDTAATSGKLYVQLLASRSQNDALDAWKRLQSKNGDLLGDLGSSVARADLGDRGVYYRLRAGPIASEARAKSLCSALADRKVSCLIVRNGA